jgi:hypothetical protein
MNMSVPAARVEVLKYTFVDLFSPKGRLDIAWDKHVASVPITVK